MNHYRSGGEALLLHPLTYSGRLASPVGRGVRTILVTASIMLWSQGGALILIAMEIRGGLLIRSR